MKLAKRIISVLLVLATVFGMIGSLSACSMSANKIKVGDWFSMIIDRFGITGYNSTEPYFSDITSSNKYFDVVQAAYEWDIIDGETEFDLEENLSKSLAANTLVRAVGMADIEGLGTDEITQFAVDNGYVTFNYRGRTDGKRLVSEDEATASLDAAFDLWANFDFGAPQESLTVADDVFVVGANSAEDSGSVSNSGSGIGGIGIPGIGDSGTENAGSSETGEPQTDGSSSNSGNGGNLGSQVGEIVDDIAGIAGDVVSDGASSVENAASDISEVLKEADVEQNWLEENVVAIPEKDVEGLKEGDTYVVPGTDSKPSATYKVDEIKYEDGYAIIRNDASGATFEETVQDLDASGTFTPDFSEVVIYDGNGKRVSGPSTSNTNVFEAPKATFADHKGDTPSLSETGVSLDFSIDGLKIKGSASSNSISFSVTGDVVTNKTTGAKVKVSKSYEIKDIKLSYDYDVKWFELKSAYAKLDYTTVDTSAVSFSWSKTGVFAPSYTNGNGKFPSNFKRAVLKDSDGKGAKSIKICSVPLASGGVASFNLEVKLKISISGKVELVVTTNNTKGIEYKNNSIRYIKDEKTDVNLTAQARAELTLYAGVAFKAVGFNIVGLGIEGGIGVVATITAYLADTSDHLLDTVDFGETNCEVVDSMMNDLDGKSYTHDELGAVSLKCETCIDITTYGILKFSMDSDSVISKLLKGPFEHEFINEKNGKIEALCLHVEDGKIVPKCTRNYKGIEEEETTTSESTTYEVETGVIEEGDMLDLETYFLTVGAGETGRVVLTELPEGYTTADVTYTSTDTKIATVDGFGTVRGVDGGAAEIKVQTKDGKYKASCNVYVTVEKVEFEPVKPVEL